MSKSTDNASAVSKLPSIVVMMANGNVWVFPIRFPANIIVAPNSDNARAQASIKPVKRGVLAKGYVMSQKVFQGDTPKVCETS